MRSLTWTATVQYFLIALACLLPAAVLVWTSGSFQDAQDFQALLTENLAGSREGTPKIIAGILFYSLGIAALPHLLSRKLAALSGGEAGLSAIWIILSSLSLLVAGFVLVQLLVVATGTSTIAGPADPLGLAALFSALPAVLGGLVLAAGIAAFLSLGQAALFAAASVFSHDVWDEAVDMAGPAGRRMIIARIALIALAALAAPIAVAWQISPGVLLEWALALAAAGIFSPLLLGIWWRRCNEIGAIGGIVAGFGCTTMLFLMNAGALAGQSESGLAQLGPIASGLVAAGFSFAVTTALSLLTPAGESDLDDLFATLRGSKDGRLAVSERPA
jgi:Na+(H+)/acetate symporter ActP